jgi:hypothetical protein
MKICFYINRVGVWWIEVGLIESVVFRGEEDNVSNPGSIKPDN